MNSGSYAIIFALIGMSIMYHRGRSPLVGLLLGYFFGVFGIVATFLFSKKDRTPRKRKREELKGSQLTPSEKKTLQLLEKGVPAAEIARQHNVEKQGIYDQLERIAAKLGVDADENLPKLARSLGMLD